MKRAIITLLHLLAIGPAAAQDAQRSLENVTDDVWQFTNNAYQAAAVVTDEGVVVTDPISANRRVQFDAHLRLARKCGP
jgi:hypothetical protein